MIVGLWGMMGSRDHAMHRIDSWFTPWQDWTGESNGRDTRDIRIH